MKVRNRIAIECATRVTRRTLTAAAAAAASGLILRSYSFMALDRGRWPPPPLPLPPELTELRRARELALALVECGTGKSRSARLRLVPMHSLLPLSPLRALSRPGPPSLPPRSLDLSLLFSFSRSLVPSHGYAALALHLYALDASSYSSLSPPVFL